jgi:AraC family ethanolamine operon transcriptional activator
MKPLIIRATDIEEMASAFQGWQMEVVQQECGKFQGLLHGFSSAEGRINFYSATINKRVFANGHHLPESVMFTFITCPNYCTWNGELIHPLKLFVSDSERGLDLDAGEGFVSYSVSINRELLQKWLLEENLQPPGNYNFILDFKKTNRVEAAMQFRQAITNAVYRGEFNLTDFKFTLLKAVQPLNREKLSRISINFAPIHESVEMIHEAVRQGQEVNLQNVLEFYGGPTRTFYYNFKKYTGCTPHQYIKNLRLTSVQKMLKMADPNVVGVREVAYQYGFRHLGQFAQDYRKLFGEMPSHRLKRESERNISIA